VINRALAAWYHRTNRPVPWRALHDPWPILVSEVMAQQTQLVRVVPAWERFMTRFPDPAALATSDVAELIEVWAGLGYQRRALNLRRAAAELAEHGWPTTAAGLVSLPGVGPYTAAAVACFAFGEAVPAIDTNLRRVLSRWEGRPLTGRALTEAAWRHLDRERPATWNQAIMDLGAAVCRPADPRCHVCPVNEWCADPTVYLPPPRQTRYQGSVRQARASVMRTLAGGPIDLGALAGRLGIEPDRLERAVAALESEGAVTRIGTTVTLGG
jgi:A/G-specific adenine glycosylase